MPPGDYAFPGETLEDWVSYGDQLSVVSVLDSTGPETPRDYKDQGGLIGRTITIRVDRTLWRRAGAHALRGRTRIQAWGWMMESDQVPDSPRRPIVVEGAPRMEAGRRYLAVLVRSHGEWSPLTDGAVMTVDDSGVVTSAVPAGDPVPGAAALRGRTVAGAGAVLARTAPDPVAARHFDLPPPARYRAVARAHG